MEEIIVTKAKVDRKRPWISVREKCIYIPTTYDKFADYKSYKLIQQWDAESQRYIYQIIFYEDEYTDTIKIQKDGFGRIKIKLSNNADILNEFKCNINIELIDKYDTTEYTQYAFIYIIAW